MRWAICIIAWAAMTVGFVTALSAVWPPTLQEPYKTVIILSILIGLSTLNILGVKMAKILNNLVTFGKLLPLFLFAIVGVFYIKGGNFDPMFPKGFEIDSFGTPRSGAALAQDGMIPRKIAEESRFGTPYLAIIIFRAYSL